MAAGIASCCAVLSLSASSPAAVRFAEPAGVTVGSCTQSAPCDLQFAVETVAQPNDEVVVTPGTYALGAGNLAIGDSGLDLHGQAGRPRPLITSSAALSGVNVPVPATVRHLRIEFTGALYGINLAPGSGEALAEGLIVRASGAGACRLGNAAIRDSVCRANPAAPGTDALVMAGTGSSSNASATATNVTAVTGPTFTGSETYGIYVAAQSASLVLQGKNVIAGGVDGDVRVETSGSGSPSAAAFLIHSSFSAATGAGPGTEFLPVPGANGNQTAEPQFVDLAAGDFHQAPGSPTINAGTAGSGLGSTDLDGEPRVQGSAPDIGADEFTQTPPPPPPPPAVTAPPAEPPVVEADRSAPGISGASLARRRFRVGTTLRFTLSEHAGGDAHAPAPAVRTACPAPREDALRQADQEAPPQAQLHPLHARRHSCSQQPGGQHEPSVQPPLRPAHAAPRPLQVAPVRRRPVRQPLRDNGPQPCDPASTPGLNERGALRSYARLPSWSRSSSRAPMPSLRKMLRMCASTVLRVMNRACAISRLPWP